MNNYEKLQGVLKEIFEMDKADLDFGIYRIMNQKRKEVMDFIDRRLPQDIKAILSETQSKDSVGLQAELEQLGKSLDNAGVSRESSPKYLDLKQQLTGAIDTNALEQDIFSHLANFFKRYYKDGDFISLRRYKKDVYAIPYEGEEVKLYWANHDQYYIKTSEYLKNYTFKLSNGKKVHFQLKEASTEQNNNKTQGDLERRFAIYDELPVEEQGDDLYINFTYEPHKKSVKQDDLAKAAIEVIQTNIPLVFTSIFDKAPTDKNKSRTILEKYLNDFISRNTFDYFIHKDLGGFLHRELDFYIKNEVLFIDDINTENTNHFTAQLSKIKALKSVAGKIITFLAQIEDFQKKLWLKKKFIVSTNYCVTLDRVPEKYYEKIITNQAQLDDWKTLFDVSVSTVQDLKNEPYLVLDTKYFSEEFKDKLIGEFDNLDEETDGVLINSENFQALNLMQEKYEEKIDTIYIDPPYNAKSSEIAYKNSFKHSSWISLMENRIIFSLPLLNKVFVYIIAVDEIENFNIGKIIENIFVECNDSTISIVHNPTGQQGNNFSYTHEFAHFIYPKDEKNYIGLEDRNDKTRDAEPDIRPLRNVSSGKDHLRQSAANCFYPIYVKDNQIIGFGDVCQDDFHPGSINIKREDNIIEIYPIDPSDIESKWVFARDTVESISDELTVKFDPKKKTYDIIRKKSKFRYKSLWSDKRYSANSWGSVILNNIIPNTPFKYPKSIYTAKDCIDAGLNNSKNGCVLDYFAGSGTTGHATIKLNREDEGKRKYILVEMGTYFDTVTKPRIQKVIYSDNWKNGKPQDKIGISQMFKYQVLESYEDSLNNLLLNSTNSNGMLQFSEDAQEEYLLKYMLDVESRDHLFNIELFRNPFNYQLNVTENNELVPTKIDLIETFNYLIGLYVERIQRVKDIKLVEGVTREGLKTLIMWRNLETTNNEETEQIFRRLYDGIRSSEFDQIYINGDHHFDNVRTDEDQFKVKLIEEAFFKKMFNISEL